MIRKPVLLLALLTVAFLATVIGNEESSNSDYSAMVQKAMEQLRIHGSWLKSNVTDLLKNLKIDSSQDQSAVTTSNTDDLWSMESLETMIAKLREQMTSYSKHFESKGGQQTALQTMWEALKDKFVYAFNVLTGKTSIQQAVSDIMGKIGSAARIYFTTAYAKFTNSALPEKPKLTDNDKDLQNANMNTMLEQVFEAGKKVYDETNAEESPLKAMMSRVNSLWDQVFTEAMDMKNILNDKEAIAEKLAALKQTLSDKGPEPIKNLLSEYEKNNKDNTNLINLISMAVGKKISELMNDPSLVSDFIKNLK